MHNSARAAAASLRASASSRCYIPPPPLTSLPPVSQSAAPHGHGAAAIWRGSGLPPPLERTHCRRYPCGHLAPRRRRRGRVIKLEHPSERALDLVRRPGEPLKLAVPYAEILELGTRGMLRCRHD